jgi:hypothetical protein
MTTLEGRTRLIRVAAVLRAGERMPRDDALWLAEAFEACSRGADLDYALGVRRRPGQRSVETLDAIQLRDRLIREAADTVFSSLSANRRAQAEAIAKELRNYFALGWLRDRGAEICPPRDKRRAMFWQILKAHPVALSSDRIRKILGREL